MKRGEVPWCIWGETQCYWVSIHHTSIDIINEYGICISLTTTRLLKSDYKANQSLKKIIFCWSRRPRVENLVGL